MDLKQQSADTLLKKRTKFVFLISESYNAVDESTVIQAFGISRTSK